MHDINIEVGLHAIVLSDQQCNSYYFINYDPDDGSRGPPFFFTTIKGKIVRILSPRQYLYSIRKHLLMHKPAN